MEQQRQVISKPRQGEAKRKINVTQGEEKAYARQDEGTIKAIQ